VHVSNEIGFQKSTHRVSKEYTLLSKVEARQIRASHEVVNVYDVYGKEVVLKLRCIRIYPGNVNLQLMTINTESINDQP